MTDKKTGLIRRIMAIGRLRPLAWFGRTRPRKVLFLVCCILLMFATLHACMHIAFRRAWRSERQMDLATESMLHGQFEDALDHYDQALDGVWWRPQALIGRGLALMYLRRYDEALASYERLLRFDRDNPQGWQGRGMSLEFMGRYDEAITAYDRALEISPNYGLATSQRARLRELTTAAGDSCPPPSVEPPALDGSPSAPASPE